LYLGVKVNVFDSQVFVVPAKAGIQGQRRGTRPWTPACAGATIPVANIGETFGNLRNEVLVKHRRSSGRQNMVDQGVIVRPEGVYDR
jgi:hypothetical protein